MKTYINLKKRFTINPRSGFALIATIVVTALLMLVALAMLSLSNVTTKTSSQGNALEEARQNARLSLMMAIGQLQSLSGPDTRITASSRMLDETNVEVTGVWRSWEGMNRDDSGKPTIPNYSVKMDTGDPEALFEDGERGRFLGWLGSGSAESSVGDLSDYSSVANGDDFIQLIGEGSVTEDTDHVYVKPRFIQTDDGSGALAWWTSGNSTKATLNVDREAVPDDGISWQERVRSNGRPDAEVFGLDAINNLEEGNNIPSRASLKLVDGSAEIRRFHDVTNYSRGLLINAAAGGWKKDFSLFSEQYDDLPLTGLPSLTAEPGEKLTLDRITGNGIGNRPSDSPFLLYPWSRYRTLNSSGWGQVPPICSWTSLVDYALQYRELNSSNASRTAMQSTIANISGGSRFRFQDQVRRMPVMARVQWIFSLCSENLSVIRDEYLPGMMITPVVTLWNPYNVELSYSQYDIKISRQGIAPLKFQFEVENPGEAPIEYPITSVSNILGLSNDRTNLQLTLPPDTLAPGATKVYSIADTQARRGENINNTITLTPGYVPGGGFRYFGIDGGNTAPVASKDATLRVTAVEYSDSDEGSIGLWFNNTIEGQNQAQRMGYRESELFTNGMTGRQVLEALYPRLLQSISTFPLSAVSGNGLNTQPFCSSLFGYRMATPISNSPNHTHLFSKGMIQANPLNFYAEVGNQDNGVVREQNGQSTMLDSGVFHPVNAPYDFAFLDVNSWNDTQFLPQADDNTNSSYIVSGLTAGTGLTRCVIAELPTRPLQSLAQLQHFDARNNNPVPPFQFNMIGNGSAQPILGPTQLTVNTEVNVGMVNDDVYLLNSVLFDDWFVSSIAPDLSAYSNDQDRSIEEVYEAHVNGNESLPNRFYVANNNADAASIESESYQNSDDFTYEAIASELEVEGAFNVNSVSVDAWKAILRHSRLGQVPYLTPNGSTEVSGEATFPYPRTSIAGDRSVLSGSNDSTSGSDNPNAAAYAGVPDLTEQQIDALAEEIVSEIRMRGPFLSLSEFVNRQLTTNEDLALASTIQKALDNLALRADATNPYAAIQSQAHEITEIPPGPHEYGFEAAALGSSAFGVPGWIRQADILTPLAPIMTVRDDTFTIRAYGDARDAKNPEVILATAWCEATVQRRPDYVDSVDDNTAIYSELSNLNKRFGRKYEIISFRWLHKDEI